jgi:hypothetical protein
MLDYDTNGIARSWNAPLLLNFVRLYHSTGKIRYARPETSPHIFTYCFISS